MRAAGVRQFGDAVEGVELTEPRALRPDEVLIDVRACGIGNWDEIVRSGGWDLGARPPMALGTEAAGLAAAVGEQVAGIRAGDRVTAHSLPLREQGAWAERHIAAAEHVAVMPTGVPFDAAAVLPVPALTADQALGDALEVRAGETVLVNGAGGVTLSARLRSLDAAGCRLLLGAAAPGLHVEIAVRDTGCGLTQERLNALFASMLVRGKPRQGGLGLAVVYGIVRAHRGGLCLKPVPPPGTHVCICLPVAPPLG